MSKNPWWNTNALPKGNRSVWKGTLAPSTEPLTRKKMEEFRDACIKEMSEFRWQPTPYLVSKRDYDDWVKHKELDDDNHTHICFNVGGACDSWRK